MLRKWFLSHNFVSGIIKTPKFHPFIQHSSFPFSPSRFFTTTTASEPDTHPFAVSYLINNFGFSTQSALTAFNQKQVRFKSPDKPDSVINFFKNHDFSHSNIHTIITKEPRLLSAEPHKNLLPKFQFFLSKGVSSSHIVSLLTANPTILQSSLEKRIIPIFELLSRFLNTDKDVIVCLIRHSYLFASARYDLIVANINLMTDFGVCDSAIATLLETRPAIFGSTDLKKLKKLLKRVKFLGFDPSLTTFGTALLAMKYRTKKLSDEKVDTYTFKKWGWSDEDIVRVFKLYPFLECVSVDKVNLFMSFWVNQLGWDSLELTKYPQFFTFSLHYKIIPRASVLQYLLMKGLRKKDHSISLPFLCDENFFLKRYVFRFKEESDYLIKLYREKMIHAYTEDNSGISLTKSATS